MPNARVPHERLYQITVYHRAVADKASGCPSRGISKSSGAIKVGVQLQGIPKA